MRVNDMIAQCNDFERSFLTAPGAVLNVQLAKVMCVFMGLALAKIFPEILTAELHWFLLGAALAAVLPVSHALDVLRTKLASGIGERVALR